MKIKQLYLSAVAILVVAMAGCERRSPGTDDGTVAVVSVGIENPDPTVEVDGRETLRAIVMPRNATDRTVVWSIDEPSIATVDATTGEIRGVTPGSATVTVTTADGGYRATCKVTVKHPSITMTTTCEGEFTLKLGGEGVASIDWGDGGAPQKIELEAYGKFLHIYSGSASGSTARTIVVEGKAVTHMDCANCNLTNLDVSRNLSMETLYCSYNQLTALDVSRNRRLKLLECYCCEMETLNVAGCRALANLRCDLNGLTALDVADCAALEKLKCRRNRLSKLALGGNPALAELDCEDNLLTTLEVDKNTRLKFLECSTNRLTTLSTELNVALEQLLCYNNHLTTLDVTKNTALRQLNIASNELTSLTVGANRALVNLYCHRNPPLKSLDVKGCATLCRVEAANCALEHLDLEGCTGLASVGCSYNRLSLDALDAIFAALHSGRVDGWSEKTIYIRDNPGTPDCNASIATGRGWIVDYQW